MQILQIHNFYKQPGGEDVVLSNEEQLLVRNGHHVLQFVMHNHDVAQHSPFRVALKTLWNQEAYDEIATLLRSQRVDVVHVHNTFPLISPSVYYAAHAAHVPVVQTLHNYRLLCPAATFFRDGDLCERCLGKTFAWPGVVHRCYRNNLGATGVTAAMLATHRMARTYSSKVACFIALSKFSKDKFVEGGIPAGRIAVKSNFVLDDPGIGRPSERPYVLFAGRLAREKGVHTLLKAWSQLPVPVTLRIVGDGALRPEVEAAAQTNPNIEYLGFCSHVRVYELMRNASLLIFPSEWYEASPLSVMEAMACGTPVLAADHGSLTEMVVPKKSGMLFAPGNVSSLVDCVKKAFANPKYLCEMRCSTRCYYEKNFAPGPNYDALMAIYNGVLAEGTA